MKEYVMGLRLYTRDEVLARNGIIMVCFFTVSITLILMSTSQIRPYIATGCGAVNLVVHLFYVFGFRLISNSVLIHVETGTRYYVKHIRFVRARVLRKKFYVRHCPYFS